MGLLSNSSGSWGIKAVEYKEYPGIYFLIMNIFMFNLFIYLFNYYIIIILHYLVVFHFHNQLRHTL